jgi:exonuclease VII small subunit
VRQIPLDQAIELVKDARSLLNRAQTFLGPAEGLLEQILP